MKRRNIILGIFLFIMLISISISFPLLKNIYLQNTNVKNEMELRALIITNIITDSIKNDTVLFHYLDYKCGNTSIIENLQPSYDIGLDNQSVRNEVNNSKSIFIYEENEYFEKLDSLMNRQKFYNQEARRIDSLKKKAYTHLFIQANKYSNSNVVVSYSCNSQDNICKFIFKDDKWTCTCAIK